MLMQCSSSASSKPALDALIVVPPLLNVVAGPLLGPAMLAGAARSRGCTTRVLDLNAAWIAGRLRREDLEPADYVGDHDKPEAAMAGVAGGFVRQMRALLPTPPAEWPAGEPALALPYGHGPIREAAESLLCAREGEWLASQLLPAGRTRLLAVSVLHAGQVVWGLATTLLARRLWPGVVVLWGGAHVTGLRQQICHDPAYYHDIDGFAFGYAERTFADAVQAASEGAPLPRELLSSPGAPVMAREDTSVLPDFSAPHPIPWPRPTLPSQSSRGCGYGRCAFCTYPAIEGAPRLVPLEAVRHTVDLAAARGAAVSFKDSLMSARRMEAIAEIVGGRCAWSACTKLSPELGRDRLLRLAEGGCRTLELGLETLSPAGQAILRKPQPLALFERTLDAIAGSGISLIVNYLVGVPGVAPGEEERYLALARQLLELCAGELVARLEMQDFELERLAPLRDDRLHVEVSGAWPWASILAWRLAPEAGTARHAERALGRIAP